MPTSYSTLLGLALPVTGELSGTWGDEVNNYITQYLDAAVAGTQTISGSQTAVTLSKTTGSSLSQAGSGATGSSQYQIINCTGNPASLLTITAPAASKPYIVINATSTNQQVKLVGTGPTTGVTLDAGERSVVAWNGSDFVKVASSAADGVASISFGTTGLTPSTATTGAVTVAGTLATGNGGTGLTTFTAGNNAIYSTSSSALTAGTLPVAAGGTGITSGTSGGVLAFTASGTIASSNALAANAIVIGGGAGAAPSTTTTGTGVLTALGNNANATGGFTTINGTATLTNKRIDPRVSSTTSTASITPDISAFDQYAVTAQAAALAINAPTGTPVDGNRLIFRLLDNGTARALTWDATYTAIGVTLPTTTVVNKTTYVGCIYNANNTRWDVVAVTTQA